MLYIRTPIFKLLQKEWTWIIHTQLTNLMEFDVMQQWRSQKLCVGADPSAGGARVEASKAPSGLGFGEGCPLPSRLGALGERRELPRWGPGQRPATNVFSAYSRPYSGAEPIGFVLFL